MKNDRFFCSSFEIPPKFSDFVNSYDFIGKFTSKSIELPPVFIKDKLQVNKKIRNSVNCIYEYAHSFFGEDFIQCVILVYKG